MKKKQELRNILKPLAKIRYSENSDKMDSMIIEISQRADTIIAYMGDMYEYKIDSLLKGKSVYYPKILPDSKLEFVLPEYWEGTHFGIPVPVGKNTIQPKDADLIFIPALGFNRSMYRLGRGYGHYDKSIDSSYYKNFVGVCYSDFIVDFEEQPYDIRVEYLITEKGIIY